MRTAASHPFPPHRQPLQNKSNRGRLRRRDVLSRRVRRRRCCRHVSEDAQEEEGSVSLLTSSCLFDIPLDRCRVRRRRQWERRWRGCIWQTHIVLLRCDRLVSCLLFCSETDTTPFRKMFNLWRVVTVSKTFSTTLIKVH